MIEVRLQRVANLLKWEGTLRSTVGDLSESKVLTASYPFQDDNHDYSPSTIHTKKYRLPRIYQSSRKLHLELIKIEIVNGNN